METVTLCESRNSDIEIPDPLNRVRFMGIDFGVASSLDLLPKSIIHTYRFPSRWRYREFYPWVNVCVSISSAAPFLLDRGSCVCLCSWGGLYDNTFPCSHPTVIIDKTLARLTPTGSMRPDAPGGEDSVNSTRERRNASLVALTKISFFKRILVLTA